MKTIIALFIGLLLASGVVFAQASMSDVTYDDNGRFAVQVEAWRSEVKAEQRVSFWKKEGVDHCIFVQEGNEESGDIWYRVLLGRFANMENAREFKRAFAEMYKVDTWITTTRSDKPITTL